MSPARQSLSRQKPFKFHWLSAGVLANGRPATCEPPSHSIYGAIDSFRSLIITPILVLSAILVWTSWVITAKIYLQPLRLALRVKCVGNEQYGQLLGSFSEQQQQQQEDIEQ